MKNMTKINYQKKLDEVIEQVKASGKTPTLLLHACCAPCSSYVLEYLSEYFSITLMYYNPNISPSEEFYKREDEVRRLIAELPAKNKINLVVPPYNDMEFYDNVKGYEQVKEGGERCFICYRLRLEKAAEYAASNGFDMFTSTLSISPYKNAEKLNEIATELEKTYGVKALPADFKKRNGYKRSIELSAKYHLYRQDYCGCIFSKLEREKAKDI